MTGEFEDPDLRGRVLHRVLDRLTDDQLSNEVEVPENGSATGLDCWHTLFEEEFEHRRYALRDLAKLEG